MQVIPYRDLPASIGRVGEKDIYTTQPPRGERQKKMHWFWINSSQPDAKLKGSGSYHFFPFGKKPLNFYFF